MTHEILERIFTLVLRNQEFSIVELSLRHYKDLKQDLDVTDDITDFLGLRLVIKETNVIHVR